MKRKGTLFGALVLVLSFSPASRPTGATLIDELITEAKKEGTIEFNAFASLTPQGAQALGDAFNRKHGLTIRLNHHLSGNINADVVRLVTQAAVNVSPEWDVFIGTDTTHATLWVKKLLQPFDYRKLGVDPKAIQYDNGAVSFAHQFVLPAYNKKFLPTKDIPKTWEDLLDSKWKGKIGVVHITDHWARLAVGAWGEDKATQFVRRLASLQPILGTTSEMYTRLQIGEVLLVASIPDVFIHRAETKRIPLAHAEVEPIIMTPQQAGVPKGAVHPSGGHLMTAFLTTPEAQQIWEKYIGSTSAFVSGTKMYHSLAKAKQIAYMTQDQAQTVGRLATEYAKILGFKR